MKYKYHGYFSVSRDKRTCIVEVPALKLEFELERPSIFRFKQIRDAEAEVGLHVYLMERAGEELPPDEVSSKKRCTYSALLRVDTASISKKVEVVKECKFDD